MLYLLPMKPQNLHEMRVQPCVKDVENGRLDRLSQLDLIGRRRCDRLLNGEIYTTFIGLGGGPGGCPSLGDFFVK